MYKQIIRTFKPDGRTVTSIEKRYTFMGNYGAKGEKRRKKEKPTPEQVEYQNRMNRARRYRYWIKANFTTEDIFTTLTYGPGERKPIEEVQKDFKRFWRRLRARYEKMGIPLKLIYVIEIGSHGGMHVHLIVNECGCTAKLISELWTHGHPNYKQLYEEGDYRALAEYLAKVPPTKDGKTKVERCRGKPERIYGHSRNLREPEIERKTYTRRTVRRIREALEGGTLEGARWITPGYRVDRESIRAGVNPYTGLSYLEFTETPVQKPAKPHKCKVGEAFCRERSDSG